ncbi:sulfurtransferase [uncultured Cetobacterium sp.]|uniref:sulfurtransferase n=1 Tax=uncultured Cetobacterium sp. TaxID=527638 RepID=UPI0026189FAD|nr:rhodanese-like domain-containing protein [uncultured Cetobacterium sp.]
MKKIILIIFTLMSTFLFTKNITTKQVKENLNKKNWVIIDTRSSDSFNGWMLEGAKREGHIKGATDFSANWLRKQHLTKKDLQLLDKRLIEKNINKNTNVVLYDFSGKDSALVEKYLKEKGIKNIYTYNGKEWINNTNLPMEKFENYQMLVPPIWVDQLVKGNKPKSYNGNGYKVFEVSWGPINDALSYIRAHIKGAVHINTNEIEHAPNWSVNSDSKLIDFAKNNGININDTIILYGEDVMASYRVAMILRYIGVKDVKIINGGTQALIRDNIPMERGIVDKESTKNIGTNKIVNKYIIDDMETAKKILKNKNKQLIDIRSWNEYIGKISGYSYMDRKGRPTGSIWGNSGTTANSLESYRNIDDTMRNPNEILALWQNLNVDTNKQMTFFCGSGWRAAEVYIYSKVLGIKNSSVYSNGWMEWSCHKENPITVEK